MLLSCYVNNWCDDAWWFFYGMLAHGMIKFKTKLSINWYTIIVIAIPFSRFQPSFSCCFSSYSCFKLLTLSRVLTNIQQHSLDHSFIPHLKKCTFCFYYAFVLLLLRVCVCFFYPCFFRYFSFFLLVKDNSNNNCFFEYFLFTSLPLSLYLLCVCFLVLV